MCSSWDSLHVYVSVLSLLRGKERSEETEESSERYAVKRGTPFCTLVNCVPVSCPTCTGLCLLCRSSPTCPGT
jgi:hypothetical protein